MVTSVLSNRQLRRDAGCRERALRQNDGPSEQRPINHPLWSRLSAGGPTRRLGVNIILDVFSLFWTPCPVVRDNHPSRGSPFVHVAS